MFLLATPAAFEPPISRASAFTPCGPTAIHEVPRGSVEEIGRGHPLTVRCLAGVVWVTQEGDSRDHILGQGQCVQIEGLGRVLAEALADTRFAVEQAA